MRQLYGHGMHLWTIVYTNRVNRVLSLPCMILVRPEWMIHSHRVESFDTWTQIELTVLSYFSSCIEFLHAKLNAHSPNEHIFECILIWAWSAHHSCNIVQATRCHGHQNRLQTLWPILAREYTKCRAIYQCYGKWRRDDREREKCKIIGWIKQINRFWLSIDLLLKLCSFLNTFSNSGWL